MNFPARFVVMQEAASADNAIVTQDSGVMYVSCTYSPEIRHVIIPAIRVVTKQPASHPASKDAGIE